MISVKYLLQFLSTSVLYYFFSYRVPNASVICNIPPCFLCRSNNEGFHLPLAWGSSFWSSWSPVHRESKHQPWLPGEPELCGHLWSPGPADFSQSQFRAHRLSTALSLCRQVNNLSSSVPLCISFSVSSFHFMVISSFVLQSMNWSPQLTRVRQRDSSVWRYGTGLEGLNVW